MHTNSANSLPDNVPGRFYIDDNCIDCDLCRDTSPANFARNDQLGYSFVAAQPANAEEEKLCAEAAMCCPVEAIKEIGG
jgi:ferredoxin